MLMTTCSLGLGELRSSNSTPRKHSQRQIKKAKDLFAKQSIVVPIIVDEYHHIIDGHLRFMVARELGIENLNAVVVSEASSRKYTKYANYTPWPTPCEVAVEMQTMASCEHLAAATQGWAAFDWAEHCLKQERRIGEGDVCARYIWRQWQIG